MCVSSVVPLVVVVRPLLLLRAKSTETALLQATMNISISFSAGVWAIQIELRNGPAYGVLTRVEKRAVGRAESRPREEEALQRRPFAEPARQLLLTTHGSTPTHRHRSLDRGGSSG